jgi:hypothetical protein
MKIDSKVRIACLAVSFLSLSWLLILRYPAIASGTSSTSDIVILLLWVGLMLAPILQEVNLFGLQLKRSIESLMFQSTQRLVQADLLSPGLAAAMRDVYAICSAAIHGEKMSPKQLAFAKEIGPGIVLALRGIPSEG